jgi:hypothetical protein
MTGNRVNIIKDYCYLNAYDTKKGNELVGVFCPDINQGKVITEERLDDTDNWRKEIEFTDFNEWFKTLRKIYDKAE